MSSHAILSPSSASRWLTCTPSARLEEGFPNEDSEFAKEGTLAHEIGEKLLREKQIFLHLNEYKEYKKNPLFNDTLYEHAQDYAQYVRQYSPNEEELFIEMRLDLRFYVPEGFGTGDAASIDKNVLNVFDLKYGKGVLVEIEGNKQLKIYSLGWLELFQYTHDIDIVRMHIYQPRLNNIGFFEMHVNDIYVWAESTLKPAADMAFGGVGNFVPGDHCRFCRAAVRCKALADYTIEIAKKRFATAELLTDQEIVDILLEVPTIKTWIETLVKYALSEATKGKKWPGLKLVEGKSNRQYSDEKAVADAILKNLYRSDMYKPKELLGLGELEALIGKNEFAQHVEPLLIRPPGKPTLVLDSDKRPEFNTAKKAFDDGFSEENNEFL